MTIIDSRSFRNILPFVVCIACIRHEISNAALRTSSIFGNTSWGSIPSEGVSSKWKGQLRRTVSLIFDERMILWRSVVVGLSQLHISTLATGLASSPSHYLSKSGLDWSMHGPPFIVSLPKLRLIGWTESDMSEILIRLNVYKSRGCRFVFV